jgi:hypothetical protein
MIILHLYPQGKNFSLHDAFLKNKKPILTFCRQTFLSKKFLKMCLYDILRMIFVLPISYQAKLCDQNSLIFGRFSSKKIF